MNRNKKLIVILIAIFTVVTLGGLSYAYFTANEVQNNVNSNNIQTITADYGNIIVTYSNNNGEINAGIVDLKQSQSGQDKLYIMKFTVESTANVTQDIQIQWKELTNDFCQYQNGGVCTNNSNHTFVGDELTYNLYNCVESDDYTTSAANDIKQSCTSIGTNSVPVTGVTSKLHNNQKITLQPNSMNYYILLITIKNIDDVQNYQQEKHFSGRLDVQIATNPLLIDLIEEAHEPVSDAIASTYVTSATGINFSKKSSLTNGQGLYTNNKNNGDGTVKYFRGSSYCTYPNYNSEGYAGNRCIAAGGTWSNFHCSLSDSREACETAGGTYYELKNNVMFGGYAWKVVRINSNGTIRMIYNGTTPTARGTAAQIGTASIYTGGYDTGSGPSNAANEETLVKEYVSYANSNTTSAAYKINAWYSNLLGVANKISDEEFCSDTTWGNTSGTDWDFAPRQRIASTSAPTFSCPNSETYTVANGKLANPIATITADETVYAGEAFLYTNYYSYIQTGESFLTMSPGVWRSTGGAYILFVGSGGRPYDDAGVNSKKGVRPVINLVSNAKVISGTGTLGSPWIIE